MAELEIKKTYGLFENALNKKLISVLKQQGEDVLVFPSIKAERLDLTAESVNHLKNLTGFDWIILTDTFAADYFIEVLGELEIDFYELDNVTICALGEAVADRLRFVQVHADVIPSKTNAEAVFAAISNYAGDELRDLRVLIVCEKSADTSIIEKLKSAAAVRELPIYAAGFEAEGTNLKLKTLLKGGAVDEFIFSAPDDLSSLKFLFVEENLPEILNEIRVSAASEIVFQSLQEAGLRPLYFHHK